MASNIIFYKPIAHAEQYPLPRVSILPEPTFYHLAGFLRRQKIGSSFIDGYFFYQGRYALAHALEKAGVDSGCSVLMPAYHCRSLVEPALYLKSDVVFYPLNEKLEPLFCEAEKLISKAKKPVKVMVLPHFFGFSQCMEDVVSFCQNKNILLIEDCAHTFYGTYNGVPLGKFGKFSIASPRKFLPVDGGGVFVDNRLDAEESNVVLIPQRFKVEVKALVKWVLQAAKKKINKNNCCVGNLGGNLELVQSDKVSKEEVDDSGCLQWFDESKQNISGIGFSRYLIKVSPHQWVINKRRAHYNTWLDSIDGVEGCHPLFNELPEGVVPYMFPLVLDCRPNLIFDLLKKEGVPMWRWEDIAVSDCRISKEYRESLLQLPCHQTLTEDELNWMTETVKSIVSAVSRYKEN